MDGTFPSGARLPTELELQESFGVSRTVVRDALRTLQVRGLVDVRRGTGTTVRSTPADAYSIAAATMLLRSKLTIGDVFRARAALETQLTIVAARNYTIPLLDRVEAALSRFESAVRAGEEVAAIVRAHVDFHTQIVLATDLPALEILLRPIQEMMLATSIAGQGMDPRDPASWRLTQHRAIFEALAERDEEAVSEACDRHWAMPLKGRSYAETRELLVGELLISPSELAAIPGHDDERD